MAANISGGHLNLAVTFRLAIGGNINVLTGLFYWIAQLLSAIVASFLLEFVTGGLVHDTFFILKRVNYVCHLNLTNLQYGYFLYLVGCSNPRSC